MDPNFSIAIVCECVPCNDWMAFASWYSMRKRLPDCSACLELKLTKPMFSWANRAGIKITRNSDAILRLAPTVLAVRDFSGDLTVSSSKSSNQTMFVDYADGVGDFVVEKWIDTTKVPFDRAIRRFGSYRDLTINEVAVLEFWERCHEMYRSIGG